MSVITNLTVTPNRLAIVYDYLSKREEGEDRDRLGQLLMPQALRSDTTGERTDGDTRGLAIFKEVVAEAKALGLVEETDDGRLIVPERMRPSARRGFKEVIEPLLLDPELALGAGQKGFAPSLAWFLVQDPARPLEWGQSHAGEMEDQCGSGAGKIELSNKESFQNFVYWARYLGYAWRLKAGSGAEVVMPDPTEAIARYLPEIFGGKRSMTLREFMRALAERSPVFENGETRVEVESMVPVQMRREQNTLSHSTSLALERLESKGVIKLDNPHDALDVMNLGWPSSKPASEILLMKRG
jgi:hypothetical protein